jgi:hypothetical protein
MVDWLHCFQVCGKAETSWQKHMEERGFSHHGSQEIDRQTGWG